MAENSRTFNSIYEETELIFVYGSLKRGRPNERLLFDSKSLGKAKTVMKYPLVVNTHQGYPYLLKHEGVGHNVIGELYRVTKHTIEELDKFEGNEYRRGKIKIIKNIVRHPQNTKPYEVVEANVYFLNRNMEYSENDISWAW